VPETGPLGVGHFLASPMCSDVGCTNPVDRRGGGWRDGGVPIPRTHPVKARPGDRVAVVSPSFAAPAVAPAIHDQGLRRLTELTGLISVEYPTTRRLDATAQDRAADLNTAFADPSIRAVLATIGGEDQITVVPLLDPEVVKADPKPFLGYSDNTNLLNWLWTAGVAGFYGGSTQVHLGAGPVVDPIHLAALRAALITGERLEITEPGYAEDYGREWTDPAALTEFGDREPTEPWTWAGPPRVVTGPTWGGCIEVIQWILTAGRFDADPAVLAGGVLLVESSEELIPAREFGWILRSLGERGMLAAVDAVLVARPPASNLDRPRPSLDDRAAHRAAQRDVAVETIARYNPQAVVCVGIPFGHTRPQWILPYGGEVTVDGASHAVWADYR
jgi:muramoyltetrapeptide carboxypeptidase LdcA involved in peptidoglycan recycling